jgi:molybdopterin-guanine dinucleotide biosynthesis protein A
MDAWFAKHPQIDVKFLDETAFVNINTPDDLRVLSEKASTSN